MVQAREADFSGATVLTLFPQNDNTVPLTFTAYSATVKAGFDDVAVDWDDGTVEHLVPAPNTRAVTLTHTYANRSARTVRIQNRLDTLKFSNASVSGTAIYTIGISATHTAARALTGVTTLGSNITNRSLSPGMFAHTSLATYPSAYSAPALSSTNANAKCVPFGCFYDCKKLANLDGIPAGLLAIDSYAFAHCSALTSVSGLSGSPGLHHIGFMAFGKCTSLTALTGLTVTMDPTPSNLFGGDLRAYELKEEMYPGGSDENKTYRMNIFMFPIASFAFYGCSSLTDLAGLALAPSKHVPPGAFQGCMSLSDVPASIKNAYYASAELRSNKSSEGHANEVSYTLYPLKALALAHPNGYYWPCGIYFSGDSILGPVYVDGAFSATGVTEFIGLNSTRRSKADGDTTPTKYRSIFGYREFANCPNVTTMTFVSPVDYLNFTANTFSNCPNLKDVRFPNFTKSQVQNDIWGVTSVDFVGYNASTYPFGLTRGCVITCSDGTLTVT